MGLGVDLDDREGSAHERNISMFVENACIWVTKMVIISVKWLSQTQFKYPSLKKGQKI
jgi:hypothetical protein